MRNVLIATPSYDGKLDVWYVNSLITSLNLCSLKNINLIPLWMSYDSLIQRSRNDLLQIAYNEKFDDIIWIDADIEWNPEWILKLLEYEEDVIGGTYRKKTDEVEIYTVKTENIYKNKNNLIEVEGLGMGFIKMSNKAFTSLYENAEEYENENKKSRNVFEVVVDNGKLIGEDICVCKKLRELGFSIYLDPNMTCNHIGIKKYVGNFDSWISKLK